MYNLAQNIRVDISSSGSSSLEDEEILITKKITISENTSVCINNCKPVVTTNRENFVILKAFK